MERKSVYPDQWEIPLRISQGEMDGDKAVFARLAQRLKELHGCNSIHGNLLTPDGEPILISVTYREDGGAMIRYWIGEKKGAGLMTVIKADDIDDKKVLTNSIPLGAIRAMIKRAMNK